MVHTLVAVPLHRDRVAALAGHRDFGVFQICAAAGFKVTAGAGELIPCQVVQLNFPAAATGHAGAGFPQEAAKYVAAFRATQAQDTVGRALVDFFPLDTLRLCPRRGLAFAFSGMPPLSAQAVALALTSCNARLRSDLMLWISAASGAALSSSWRRQK